MANNEDPGFYRRRVRDALRKAREKAALTQRQAAEALDWSMSKLVRIEAGTVGVSTTDLRALLRLYEVDDPADVDALAEMARAARRRPWFSKYQRILNPAFAQYLGYESAASIIRGFQPLTIPGLLQTDDYARAILEANRASYIDERVELRAARQELLDRENCPEIFYILDEAALYRRVGGLAVMRGQLRRLEELNNHPRVHVQVVPFAAGAHSSMNGGFTILEFADWDEDVLYQETPRGSVTSREDQELVADYRERFDLLEAASLDKGSTSELIERLIHDLEKAPISSNSAYYRDCFARSDQESLN
jgi:transcriptional regulator with XRE-family HTH domain